MPTQSAWRCLAMCVCATLVACGDDASDSPDAGADVGAAPITVSAFEPAFDAEPHGAMMSVWGRSASDVWVVGGQPGLGGNTPDGVAFHFDGDAWTEQALPEGGLLNWVHGTDDETWMVGEGGRALRVAADGTVDAYDVAPGIELWGCFARSETEVIAVGGNPRDEESVPRMYTFDGADWTEVTTLPDTSDVSSRALFKVFAVDDLTVAVGARGILFERRDGGDWTRVETGTFDSLISVWGTSADRMATTGGSAAGVVGRRDADGWAFDTLADTTGLNGVWMDVDGSLWLDGNLGTLLHVPAGEGEPTSYDVPTDDVLHAIWAPRGGPVFAVGGSLLAPLPWTGVALVGR